MATENPLQIVSKEAGSIVYNKRGLVETGSNIIVAVTAAGVSIDGVCAMVSSGVTGTTIPIGGAVPVCKSGTVIGESGADVASNEEVMVDSVGRFVPSDANSAVGINRGPAVTGAGKDLSIELYAKAQGALNIS